VFSNIDGQRFFDFSSGMEQLLYTLRTPANLAQQARRSH